MTDLRVRLIRLEAAAFDNGKEKYTP